MTPREYSPAWAALPIMQKTRVSPAEFDGVFEYQLRQPAASTLQFRDCTGRCAALGEVSLYPNTHKSGFSLISPISAPHVSGWSANFWQTQYVTLGYFVVYTNNIISRGGKLWKKISISELNIENDCYVLCWKLGPSRYLFLLFRDIV